MVVLPRESLKKKVLPDEVRAIALHLGMTDFDIEEKEGDGPPSYIAWARTATPGTPIRITWEQNGEGRFFTADLTGEDGIAVWSFGLLWEGNDPHYRLNKVSIYKHNRTSRDAAETFIFDHDQKRIERLGRYWGVIPIHFFPSLTERFRKENPGLPPLPQEDCLSFSTTPVDHSAFILAEAAAAIRITAITQARMLHRLTKSGRR